MSTFVRAMDAADVGAVLEADGGREWRVDRAFWTHCLAAQARQTMVLAVARLDADVAGYGYLDWNSQNAHFRQAGVPEIKDLRVGDRYRRRGVATAIIGFLEAAARRGGSRAVGLGVGLHPGYGSAQRLYARLGYVPDGRGVTYRNRPARIGASLRLNDDLLLWLVKNLEAPDRA